MTSKYFGTDGIRGRAGTFPMVPEFCVKLGWAIGTALPHSGSSRIVIGKDTRLTGYMFESSLQAGLSAAGVDCYLLGPMPTPGVAYITQSMGFDAGIVISASHNPYYDNGIKIFSSNGTKISKEIETRIEQLLEESLVTVASEKIGRCYRVEDTIKRYIAFCSRAFPENLNLNNLKIVVDAANGANYYIGKRAFADLGAQVVMINNQPNGLNINDHCGSTHPEGLQAKVLKEGAQVGIAFDGDGDRLIMVDEEGQVLDGDQLLFIIVQAAYQQDSTVPGVVGTLMTNLGLELALKEMDIPLERSKVGDRYVLEALQERHWKIGGEASGHIIHLAYSTTGDAIIAALLVLAAMIRSGKSLSQLKQGMHKYPQKLINVPVPNIVDPMTIPQISQSVADAQEQLQQRGRILLRASGTEPLIRVMVEGDDMDEVNLIAKHIAEVVEKALPAT